MPIRATLAGRKDARRKSYVDDDAHSAYTRILATRIHRGLTIVTDELYGQIQPIDHELAKLTARVIHLNHEKAGLADPTETLSAQTAKPLTDEEVARVRRRRRAIKAQLDKIHQEEIFLKAAINEQANDRYHLTERARNVALGWIDNYKRYGETYRRSFDAKDAEHRLTRLGELPTELSWIKEGVPFMVTITDPEQEQIIRSVLYRATEHA
jgi:cell division protein FtsB